MNPLFSRKLVMGLAAIAGIVFSQKLGLQDSAVYVLGAVALAGVGAQGVTDVLEALAAGKPFVLEKPKCESSVPSSSSS